MRRLPLLARLARRYAVRHRGQTVRAVLGLLVTTAVLLTGLGMGDSFSGTFLEHQMARYGGVDVLAQRGSPISAAQMANWTADPAVAASGARGAPTLVVEGAAEHRAAGKAEASAAIRGVGPGEREALGAVRGPAGDLPEPGRGSVLLAADLATRLAAGVGDTVVLRVPLLSGEGGVANLTLRVAGVAEAGGRAGVLDRPVALVDLIQLQEATGAASGANAAFYAADHPEAAAAALKALAPRGMRVEAVKVEAERVAAEEAAGFTGFILVMGGFTILASFLLAYALFAALVEERRAELGVMRALGVTRGQVALMMTLEGALYSAAASLAGLVVGFGFLAAFLQIFRRIAATFDESFVPRLAVDPLSVGLAFGLGTVLPLVIVGVASLRFARLDPARAIRGIPEDGRSRRRGVLVAAGLLLLAGLALLLLTPRRSLVLPGGWDMGMTLGGLVGIPLAGAAVALALAGRGRPVAGGLVAAAVGGWTIWTLYNFRDYPRDAGELDPMMTMARGLVLVLLLVVAAVASPAPYLALARLLGRGGRATRASFVALKYLVARRGAAGLTAAMIALVVLVVAVMGTLMAVFAAEIPQDEGGYPITGRSALALSGFPRPLPEDLAAAVARAEFLPAVQSPEPANVTRAGTPLDPANPWARLHQATGVSPAFAGEVEYRLIRRAESVGSDRQAWQAVADGNGAILPRWQADAYGLAVGEALTVQMGNSPARTYTLVGLFDGRPGIFLAADDVRSMGLPVATSVYLKVQAGINPDPVAHRLTAELGGEGLTFQSVREEAARGAAGFRSFVVFFQAFLALGLFVGLAATGFLASRAVHARVRDIGTLRAFGLEEGDIRRAFVLESAVTALLGVAIGVGVGLLVAHSVWFREAAEAGQPFTPPTLVLVAFAASVVALGGLAAWWPARRAARMRPALAVRHTE